MRKLILIAAVALVSGTSAQAGDSRSLTLAGVDEKIPAALGKAADAPKTEPAPQFVARPAPVKGKSEPSKAGQVTFEENKPAATNDKTVVEKDRPAAEKDQRTARADQEKCRPQVPYGAHRKVRPDRTSVRSV